MNEITPVPERWLAVPRYEGTYETSNFGQVRSLHRKVPHILRPSWYTGYGVVILYRDGEREGRTVHSLVMEAFAGPCPPGMEVRHLDGDPANNRWAPGSTEAEVRANGGNLIYGTSGANKDDQVRHGTHPEASRDYCDAGHEYTPENTRIDHHPDGSFKQRVCRACANDRTKERRRNLAQSEDACTSDEGCSEPVWAADLCEKHYQRDWRARNPEQAEKARQYARERYVPVDPRIVCRGCGEEFMRQPGMSANRKYCTDECFKEARAARQAARRNAA